MAKLSEYLYDTRDLLRDSSSLFYSKQQLVRYINKARINLCKTVAPLQILVSGQSPFGASAQPGYLIPGAAIPGAQPGAFPGNSNSSGAASTSSNSFNTIPNVELYPFKFANPYVQAANAGVKGIIDVMDVAVTWGGIRPAMSWVPYSELQAYARSYNLGVSSYPSLWSTFGDGENGQVWLFPIPSQGNIQGEMEWLCSCVPFDLYSDDDFEAIPDNFTDAVPFFAAFLAYLNSQRTGNANLMLNHFNDFLGLDRAASDRGKVSNYYG